MIHGHLDTPDSYQHLLAHPVWREAFDWLRNLPATPTEGIHELRGLDLYANVMRYATLPREQCRFESHRRYIDLQYTIAGAEVIDWRRNVDLRPDDGYAPETDLQFYHPEPAVSRVHMLPRHFVVFHPSDAHRPKVTDGRHPDVFKLVIKVGIHLL